MAVAGTPQPTPLPSKPNPVLTFLGSQGFHSFYHAALSGAITYVGTHAYAPTQSWIYGLLAAVLGGVVGWLNGGQ